MKFQYAGLSINRLPAIPLLFALFCVTCLAQRSIDDAVDECGHSPEERNLVFKESTYKAIDEALVAIDTLSIEQQFDSHTQLLKKAQGRLNYCDIEKSLRRLNLKTRLLALRLEKHFSLREMSIGYHFARFNTHSRVPKYYVRYEKDGEKAALALLKADGLELSDNLTNLSITGTATTAIGWHRGYFLPPAEDRSGLNPKYSRLYEILDLYRSSGHLTDAYNTSLFYTVSNYGRSIDGFRYSINNIFSPNVLHFFVIKEDPQRLLPSLGASCNCAYIPDSHVIVCDKKLLHALANWFVFSGWKQIGLVLDDVVADFLINWLIGHEIGHFTERHRYTSGFLPLISNEGKAEEVKPIANSDEAVADDFALKGMSPNLKGLGGLLVARNLFRTLFNKANALSPTREGGLIIIKSPPTGHPSMDLSPFLTQTVKTQNPSNGELSHGVVA